MTHGRLQEFVVEVQPEHVLTFTGPETRHGPVPIDV